MKCKLRTRKGLEVTSWVRQWQVVHQEPLWEQSGAALGSPGAFWSCFGITWSFVDVSREGQPRDDECPQWWAFIFTFQKFLIALNPFLSTQCFCPSWIFFTPIFLSFPSGSSRITKPQFTDSENRRDFPALSLSCFGIWNLLPPFLFSYKKQCVPYMMAYIKQFFIDLGSAYSFLEGIQI